MPERSPEEFVRVAETRLVLAASMYERGRQLPFDDRYVEMVNVATFVWSAGIDLISAHMLLDGETSLGTSVSRRYHLRSRIRSGSWPMRLRTGWSALAQLHNFQHNLDMSAAEFVANCEESAQMLADLNGLLPAALQLPRDAYAWLSEVG